jgi:hypothetical protein
MPKQLNGEYTATTCGKIITPMGFELSQCGASSHGYLTVFLGSKNRLVHRLVATAHIPNPEGKRTVNHKDGDKHNNCVDNLEWATDSENNLHAFKELGRVASRGRMRVSDYDARTIMRLRGIATQPEIAKIFGCKVSLVADIHTGRRKILD